MQMLAMLIIEVTITDRMGLATPHRPTIVRRENFFLGRILSPLNHRLKRRVESVQHVASARHGGETPALEMAVVQVTPPIYTLQRVSQRKTASAPVLKDSQRDVDVEVFDESVLPANLLFDSAPTQHDGQFYAEEEIEVESRKWILHFHSNRAFDAAVANPLSWAILGGGLLVSFLVFVALYLNANHSRKSTRDQRQLERSAREIRTLAEMTDMFQSCNSRLEAYPVIATTMVRLLPCACHRSCGWRESPR